MGLPHTMDVPLDIRTIIVEETHPFGPFGAKGVGELPLNATAPGHPQCHLSGHGRPGQAFANYTGQTENNAGGKKIIV